MIGLYVSRVVFMFLTRQLQLVLPEYFRKSPLYHRKKIHKIKNRLIKDIGRSIGLAESSVPECLLFL